MTIQEGHAGLFHVPSQEMSFSKHSRTAAAQHKSDHEEAAA